MKKHLFRAISILGLVTCMIAIFVFSCENSDTSNATSGEFIKKLCIFFIDGFEHLPEQERVEIISQNQAVIRTLAHFSIFAALGFFASLTLTSFAVFKLKNLVFSTLFCVFYALSDEIHQHFVPGRAFQFSDILVDSLGCIVGILLVTCLAAIILKKKVNKND